LPAADSVLVKVTTDQGLEGWGEAFGFRAVASAKLAVDELIAPICIGQMWPRFHQRSACTEKGALSSLRSICNNFKNVELAKIKGT
jgi:L-alanine-DL-glutamate epimerase-like enolase superfamily enzyme